MKEVKTILVAIDYSAMAQEALKRAIFIAKEQDAQLIVMHVVEPPFIESPFLKLVDKDEIRQDLENNIDELNKEANIRYFLFVEAGLAVDIIARKVETTKTDLLVIGTHGKDNIRSNYFGTTA